MMIVVGIVLFAIIGVFMEDNSKRWISIMGKVFMYPFIIISLLVVLYPIFLFVM